MTTRAEVLACSGVSPLCTSAHYMYQVAGHALSICDVRD